MSDYSSMMSEPLAIVLGLPGFLLLLLSIKLTSRKLLVFSAVLCGLALMTRYAFVAFPMAGVIVLLLLSSTPWRRRFLDTIIYGLIGFLPMLLWILQQLLKHASIGSRDYSLDILVKEKVIKFSTQVINVTKYWFPYRSDMIPHISAKMFNPILGLFFVALIGMGIILAFRHRKVDDSQRASWVLICGFVLLLGMYGVGLLTTYMVSTDLISLNDRMFSPAAPMVYGILMACALTIDRKLNLKFSFPLIGLVVTLFFVVFNFLPLRTYLINVSTYPDGYASPDWKDKPILTELKKIPSTNPILSNAPDIILFYTNHNAYYLSRAKKTQGSVVTLFDLERLRKLMSENCGVLVLFDPYRANAYEQRPSPITRPDMTNLFALYTPIYDSKDGTILVDQKCIKP